MSNLYLSITITNREDQKKFIKFYQNHGIPLVLNTLGAGTANSKVLDYLGLAETEKSVLFFVSRAEKSNKIMLDLKHTMYLDIPGNGIALNIPISSIGGKAMLVMSCDQSKGENDKMNEIPTVPTQETAPYRLIIAIANQGCSEMVMDAAKKAGASGGTVTHAKGTSAQEVEKFFGVSLASEKEIIYIACSKNSANGIMKAIANEAGINTEAKALVFSVPVDAAAGIRDLDN